MKKGLIKKIIFLSFLGILTLLPLASSFAQPIAPPPTPPITVGDALSAGGDIALGTAAWLNSSWLLKTVFSGIGHMLLTISSLALIIAGLGLDTVLEFTIKNMADVINNKAGIGGSISVAWSTLRDIANIFFIFVLLYAAFRAMFSLSFGNVGKTIVNIVLVALLINFSLFFTKVVIDASNVIAIGFYNSISATNSTSVTGADGFFGSVGLNGISAGYMKLLGLQSFYSADILDDPQLEASDILILGFMSSIFMLVSAVVLGMAAIMFVARFIILIFLMILSPIALVTIVIPGLSGQFNKWKNSLISQAFFAPAFFALTWVSFKLGSTLQDTVRRSMGAEFDTSTQTFTGIVTDVTSSFGLILNFVMIIGFSITALVVAKSIATKSAGFTSITSGIGAGVLGGVALAGRQTIGRGSRWIAENKTEQYSKTRIGRAVLNVADKGRAGSFDGRTLADSKLGKTAGLDMLGKAGGKGGFDKSVSEKAKAKVDYAKRVYGQKDAEKELARVKSAEFEEMKKKEMPEVVAKVIKTQEQSVENAKKISDEKTKKVKDHTTTALGNLPNEIERLKKEISEKESALREADETYGPESTQVKSLEKAIKDTKDNLVSKNSDFEKAKLALESDAVYKDLVATAEGSTKELKDAQNKLKNTKDKAREGKLDIDIKEFSEEAQKVNRVMEESKNAHKARLKAYAERVRKGSPISTVAGVMGGAVLGGLVGGPLGASASMGLSMAGLLAGGATGKALGENRSTTRQKYLAGNLAAYRDIIEVAEGKEKKDKHKVIKDMSEVLGIDINTITGGENKENDNQSTNT